MSFKVGDTVVLWPGNNYDMPVLDTVAVVYANGGVRLKGGKRFTEPGREYSQSWRMAMRIELATDKERERMADVIQERAEQRERGSLMATIDKVRWRSLPLPVLRQIAGLLHAADTGKGVIATGE